MKIREPVAAGQFYESSPKRLLSEIERCFTCNIGPGLPKKTSSLAQPLRGVIVPHAGYPYSGPCAAYAYKTIAEAGRFDIFILLGPNHTGLGAEHSATCLVDWKTPLGVVSCDRDFGAELIQNTTIIDDIMPHLHEHSIEVQLPFLQFVVGTFRMVPISVSHNTHFKKLGSEIRGLIKKSKKKVCIIASSDFTHYGPNYQYIPFRKNIKENIAKLDKGAIENIKMLDIESLLDYADKTHITICGLYPILLLVEILKEDIKDVNLLKYYTSGDILKDYTNSVSYVSMSFV
ncbi:MAG: AmmeMemoRadiSam system protein B [Candidatus Woesearchaeota archaeon]